MNKTIVAKFDHYVGPAKVRVIWKNNVYRVLEKSGNKILVQIDETRIFGWTDEDKF